MQETRTTVAVQHYLDALAGVSGDSPAEPIVRELLARAVNRLQLLCASLLHRSYPRLMRGPTNLQPEEMLSSVVERLIKALRKVRPGNVRQFFALANQHMRWELNDVARRLDEEQAAVELRDSRPSPDLNAGEEASGVGAGFSRVLDAIEGLPDEEREAFNLVRIQGLTQPEAASIAGCSERTLQRRLNRSLVLLTARLGDLRGRRHALSAGNDSDSA